MDFGENKNITENLEEGLKTFVKNEKCEKLEENDVFKNDLKEFLKQELLNDKDSGNKIEKAKNRVSNLIRRAKSNIISPEKETDPLNNKADNEKLEALQFMCGIMDECTHLKNFSVPVRKFVFPNFFLV